MFSTIKSISFCVIAIVGANVLSTILQGSVPQIPDILMVGGLLGLVCSSAIFIFCKERYHVAVGAASATILWFLFVAMMADEFGTSGFDTTKIIITTLIVALEGAAGGIGYKLGAR